MNPIVFAMRRPFTTLMLVVTLLGGGLLGLSTLRGDIVPPLDSPKVHTYLDYIGTQAKHTKEYVVGKYESYFHKHTEGGEEAHHEHHKIFVTSPQAKDIVTTQEYVCQIHSRTHTNIQAFESGYLKAIPVKEGQAVKEGDVLFEIVPTLYRARFEAEKAEARLAQLEYINTKTLAERQFADKQPIVSQNEVLLFEAKRDRAEAKKQLAQAELDFATVKAPFDGIIDRLKEQQGSLVKEGDTLTTLSDNRVMWVYFNVPEKQYLEYMAEVGQGKDSPNIELMLANHNRFPHLGEIDPSRNIGAIAANFNPETGNIAFRADFPNPERLLRHGQTGTVLINRPLKGAIVIPQRATFENLAKRYVYVVNKDDVVHQREITVQYELEDVYVIGSGAGVDDKIVLEGIRQVRDGDHLEKSEYEFIPPEKVMANQKNHAE